MSEDATPYDFRGKMATKRIGLRPSTQKNVKLAVQHATLALTFARTVARTAQGEDRD